MSSAVLTSNNAKQKPANITPDKILRALEERRKLLGNFELNVSFRFGGTPYDVAERGLKLFAKEVLPVLKSW